MSGLVCRKEGAYLLVTFLNAKQGNSFGVEQAQDLQKIIEQNKKDKQIKALVFLSKHPRFFCTGGNLKFYAQTMPTRG